MSWLVGIMIVGNRIYLPLQRLIGQSEHRILSVLLIGIQVQ